MIALAQRAMTAGSAGIILNKNDKISGNPGFRKLQPPKPFAKGSWVRETPKLTIAEKSEIGRVGKTYANNKRGISPNPKIKMTANIS